MMTEMLTRPDGIIAYDDTGGPAPPVIAAPGMGDTRHSYRHLRPLLAEGGIRFVTMDLRGLGETSVDWPDYSDGAVGTDMLALATHLDAGPAVLVGNSMSAASAVLAAVAEPAAVAGMVLIGPFAREVETPAWQRLLFKVLLVPPWGRAAWISYYRKQLYPGAKPPDHDEYVAALKANLGELGRFGAFRKLTANTHAESGAVLDRVECPALIIMGTADPDFPDAEEEARTLARALSGEVVLVDGAGHYPQAQAPDQVADAIAAFVAATRS